MAESFNSVWNVCVDKNSSCQQLFKSSRVVAVRLLKEFLQIDNKIKELTAQKDAIKEALTGVVGVTATGVEVRWTEVAGPKQVDKDKVQEILGFVPTIKGKDSLRLSIKHNGGK